MAQGQQQGSVASGGGLLAANNLSDVASAATARSNLGLSAIPIAGSLGMRNRIVNGDMQIDQSNGGASVVTSGAGGAFLLDKWQTRGTGAAGVFSSQQLSATPPSGFANYLRTTVTTADAAPAAGSVYALLQRIEGTYCQDFQFGIAANTQSVTFSFWVRCSLTGTFGGAIKNSAANRSYPFQYTISAANTWEQKTVTIAVDTSGTWLTTIGVGVEVDFDLGCGSSSLATVNVWAASNLYGATGDTKLIATNAATFDLTGVQLELGTVATTFERRAFGDMVRLCQREFQKSFNLTTAPVQAVGANLGDLNGIAGVAGAATNRLFHKFPVLMRAAPTLITYSPISANAQVRDLSSTLDCSGTGTNNITESGFRIDCTGNAGTAVGNLICVHWTADARL